VARNLRGRGLSRCGTYVHARERFEVPRLLNRFRNDAEFAGYRFGGIGGGAAMKYAIYQRREQRSLNARVTA
jgi:hypothetical protein